MTFKNDLIMLNVALFIILSEHIMFMFLNAHIFTFWHYMFISGAYGGYITLRLFTTYQYHLAKKKGMLHEYNEINKLEKDKN